ncbi:MAG: hypothetical protein R3293_19040 [Candidatus Promineifilaceae bacterium]|nr:hypothetical protein [Candidatus Promineifilaceae bacterium]
MEEYYLPEEIKPITIGDEPKPEPGELVLQEPENPSTATQEQGEDTALPLVEEDRLVLGQVGFGTWETAWTRLQDFHHRALGQEVGFETQVANELSPEEAFLAYSNAAVLQLAQFAAVGPQAQLEILKSVCEFADERGSLDGLESFFLNGLRAAQNAGDIQALDFAAGVLGRTGFPDALGGGVQTTALFDANSGQLALPSLDQIRRGFGEFGDSLFNLSGVGGSTPGLHDALSNLSGTSGSIGSHVFDGLGTLFGEGPPAIDLGEDMAMSGAGSAEQQRENAAKQEKERIAEGRKLGTAVGTIVGGIAGTIGGNPLVGTLVGGATGAAMGTAVGYLVHAVISFFKSDTPAPSTHDRPPAHREHHPTGGDRPPGPIHHTPGHGIQRPGSEHHPQRPAGGAHKCWEPDMSTGLPAFDGDTGGVDSGGVNWIPTLVPEGPGIDGLPVHLGGGSFHLPHLPRLNDDGTFQSLGFLADLGYEIIPPGDSLDGQEWTEIPASVETIADNIDSPDPVIGDIEELPLA